MNKLIGYHGTTKENAEKILKENDFIDSDQKDDWLGKGVYFFKYRSHAEQWGNAERFRNQEPAILKSKLLYSDDEILDLDNPEHLEYLNKIIKAIPASSASIDLSKKNIYQKMCFSCNYIKRVCPEIGIITHSFPIGKRSRDSAFYKNQFQICVNDHTIIKTIEYEEPKDIVTASITFTNKEGD